MEDSRDESRTSLVKRENGPGHNTESPEVLLAVWYNSGTLWVMINRARNLMICSGKVYGKTYLLPDSGNSKQKTQLVESSSNPQFNATIAYLVEENALPSRVITITLWNRVNILVLHLIGQIILPMVSLNLEDATHNWYTLQTKSHSKAEYKYIKNIPPAIKVGLQFIPDPDCTSINGTGTLRIPVIEARNLATLTNATNLNRVWAYCSLLPKWHTTRQQTPLYGYGGNPYWKHSFIYTKQELKDLIENHAVDISLADCNDVIGRVRFGPYPNRSINYQVWKDSTDLEASHWENILSHPGKMVVKWHQVDEMLDDRKVDHFKVPPAFIEPYTDISIKKSKSTEPRAAALSSSNNFRTVDGSTAGIVGKLLARVYFTNEALNIQLNRIAGLHGGTNREMWYNPYVKVHLEPDLHRLVKNKTPCQWKTRNPIFDTTFTYDRAILKTTDCLLRVTVWHRSRLGSSKLLGEIVFPISSLDINERLYHWYSIYQPT